MPYNVFSYCQMKQPLTAVMLHDEFDEILMSFHQGSSEPIKKLRTEQIFLHIKKQNKS